jgi:hypothetical protein
LKIGYERVSALAKRALQEKFVSAQAMKIQVPAGKTENNYQGCEATSDATVCGNLAGFPRVRLVNVTVGAFAWVVKRIT